MVMSIVLVWVKSRMRRSGRAAGVGRNVVAALCCVCVVIPVKAPVTLLVSPLLAAICTYSFASKACRSL